MADAESIVVLLGGWGHSAELTERLLSSSHFRLEVFTDSALAIDFLVKRGERVRALVLTDAEPLDARIEFLRSVQCQAASLFERLTVLLLLGQGPLAEVIPVKRSSSHDASGYPSEAFRG